MLWTGQSVSFVKGPATKKKPSCFLSQHSLHVIIYLTQLRKKQTLKCSRKSETLTWSQLKQNVTRQWSQYTAKRNISYKSYKESANEDTLSEAFNELVTEIGPDIKAGKAYTMTYLLNRFKSILEAKHVCADSYRSQRLLALWLERATVAKLLVEPATGREMRVRAGRVKVNAVVFSNCQFISLLNSFVHVSQHNANVRTFYYNVIVSRCDRQLSLSCRARNLTRKKDENENATQHSHTSFILELTFRSVSARDVFPAKCPNIFS